ncbi:MAG: hypothetical protein IJK60_02450 [Clostridia bacterium]|nr:hypothetical protein [Clostridia bacterium]
MRNTRTLMNGAHNAGGYEAMQQAASDGIILDKQWLATHDERTRDSHAYLDGETVHYNERFSNGLRYPQDPQGEAAEVYNCRCAMREITRGFYNKYTGKTEMLPDAPQEKYAEESKKYWDKYFAEKKQKEADLAAAENPNYSNKLLQNKEKYGKINKTEETDFYVGENGKALPAKYKDWIGDSKREELLAKADNAKLYNAIDQLYRPKSFIGDGGTADALRFEKSTGLNISRNNGNHYNKAIELKRNLSNKVMKEPLTPDERTIAEKLINDLNKAIKEWEE